MEKQNMNYAELEINSLKKTRNDINEGQKKYLTDEEFEKILHKKIQTYIDDVLKDREGYFIFDECYNVDQDDVDEI